MRSLNASSNLNSRKTVDAASMRCFFLQPSNREGKKVFVGRPEENSMTGAVNKWPQRPSESRKHICCSGRSASLCFSRPLPFLSFQKIKSKRLKNWCFFHYCCHLRPVASTSGRPNCKFCQHTTSGLTMIWNVQCEISKNENERKRLCSIAYRMTRKIGVGLPDPWPLLNREKKNLIKNRKN